MMTAQHRTKSAKAQAAVEAEGAVRTSAGPCEVCGDDAGGAQALIAHIEAQHELTAQEYLALYPGATLSVAPPMLQASVQGAPAQRGRPPQVRLQKVMFDCNLDVPAEACLPLPEAYQFPEHGALAHDVRHALISIKKERSVFIYGIAGSGKDALAHAVSALTRTPGLIRSIKPGVDIQSWFYNRAFDQHGTTWETGPLFEALTKGYEVRDDQGALVRRVPYLIVISDFDRADRAQVEHLRLIMDSIQGRVEGPSGQTYPVLPGTKIIATGNSAGGGDQSGRYISAHVIDASILDRFNRIYRFHWLDWADEARILRRKFPRLASSHGELLEILGGCTQALRSAIQREALYTEFSHRAVCTILGHAQDLLDEMGGPCAPAELFRLAVCAWLDRLEDPLIAEEAVKLMDPYVPGGLIAPDLDPQWEKIDW